MQLKKSGKRGKKNNRPFPQFPQCQTGKTADTKTAQIPPCILKFTIVKEIIK